MPILKILTGALFLFVFACSQTAQASSLSLSTQKARDTLWDNTKMYAPIEALTDMTAVFPAVVYLHGCKGFVPGDLLQKIVNEGYAVFVPDSFSLRSRSYCYDQPDDILKLRLAEAREIHRRLMELPWIDSRNIFLVGYSEGGLAVAMYSGSEFTGYIISGWTCTDDKPSRDGIFIPHNKPVMSLQGRKDKVYVGSSNSGSCARDIRDYLKGSHVLIDAMSHTMNRRWVPPVIEFLEKWRIR